MLYSNVLSFFILFFANVGCSDGNAAEFMYEPAACGEEIAIAPPSAKTHPGKVRPKKFKPHGGNAPAANSRTPKAHSDHIRTSINEPPNVSKNVSTRININSASQAELESLPGIGPALAKRIIAYRTKRHFKRRRDIRRVKGIGRSKFKKLEPLIAVKSSVDLK